MPSREPIARDESSSTWTCFPRLISNRSSTAGDISRFDYQTDLVATRLYSAIAGNWFLEPRYVSCLLMSILIIARTSDESVPDNSKALWKLTTQSHEITLQLLESISNLNTSSIFNLINSGFHGARLLRFTENWDSRRRVKIEIVKGGNSQIYPCRAIVRLRSIFHETSYPFVFPHGLASFQFHEAMKNRTDESLRANDRSVSRHRFIQSSLTLTPRTLTWLPQFNTDDNLISIFLNDHLDRLTRYLPNRDLNTTPLSGLRFASTTDWKHSRWRVFALSNFFNNWRKS